MPDFEPVVKRVLCEKEIKILVEIAEDSISGDLNPKKNPEAAIFDKPGDKHDSGELTYDADEACWRIMFANNDNEPHGYAIVTVHFVDDTMSKQVTPIPDVDE